MQFLLIFAALDLCENTSLKTSSEPLKSVPYPLTSQKGSHWGPERWTTLPKATQPVTDGERSMNLRLSPVLLPLSKGNTLDLVNSQIRIMCVWGQAWGSSFLTNSKVTPMPGSRDHIWVAKSYPWYVLPHPTPSNVKIKGKRRIKGLSPYNAQFRKSL